MTTLFDIVKKAATELSTQLNKVKVYEHIDLEPFFRTSIRQALESVRPEKLDLKQMVANGMSLETVSEIREGASRNNVIAEFDKKVKELGI